ncbi:MAG: hypothetical protein NTU76_01200 [Candidatus Taylorbacteria bacterium]|nr:hypothetical protein [Candidatus Taylorbacteria bacterium]
MRGRYFFGSQRAAVLVDSKNDSKLDFAERSAHELIHFNSFQSADFEPGKLSERVFGFAIMTKDGEELVPYFNDVNEAITGELAKRFDQEYFKAISALTEEIQQRDKFRAGLKSKSGATEIKSFSLKQEESGMWRARAGEYPYIEERQRLWATIADIRSKNTGQFKSNEDVFRIFTEAYFTGKFKKVAKLIDKTYGKGSFRELGKKTKAQKAAEQEKK